MPPTVGSAARNGEPLVPRYAEAVSRIPIACELTSSAATDRLAEWRSFVSSQVDEVTRTPRSAQLRLKNFEESVRAAVDLARQEKACCAFFEFRLMIGTDSASLEIRAPQGAESILDELVKLR
jgi:MerR family transcriptional regulator, copper efflux regulator